MSKMNLSHLLCMILISSLTYSQTLCYQIDQDTRVRVSEQLQTETLNVLDKLLFLKKSYSQKHKLSVTKQTEWSEEIELIEHSNIFPEWYMPPTKVIKDSQGSRSYFANDHKLLSLGWAGAYADDRGNSAYVARSKNEERHYNRKMNDKALSYYNQKLEEYDQGGILIDFEWKDPSSIMLSSLEAKGYTVNIQNQIITASSTTRVIKWNLSSKIIKVNEYNDQGNQIVRATKTYYIFDDTFQTYLKNLEIIVTPSQFSNGDCYDLITSTYYTDYSTCNNSNTIANRSTKDLENSFIIYPNPVNDELKMQFEHSVKNAKLNISGLDGTQYMMRKINTKALESTLNISSLHSGMYILTVDTGKEIFNQKFVKK